MTLDWGRIMSIWRRCCGCGLVLGAPQSCNRCPNDTPTRLLTEAEKTAGLLCDDHPFNVINAMPLEPK